MWYMIVWVQISSYQTYRKSISKSIFLKCLENKKAQAVIQKYSRNHIRNAWIQNYNLNLFKDILVLIRKCDKKTIKNTSCTYIIFVCFYTVTCQQFFNSNVSGIFINFKECRSRIISNYFIFDCALEKITKLT